MKSSHYPRPMTDSSCFSCDIICSFSCLWGYKGHMTLCVWLKSQSQDYKIRNPVKYRWTCVKCSIIWKYQWSRFSVYICFILWSFTSYQKQLILCINLRAPESDDLCGYDKKKPNHQTIYVGLCGNLVILWQSAEYPHVLGWPQHESVCSCHICMGFFFSPD